MITAYKVKYHPATDNAGARFTVTRLDDKKTYRTAYNYGAINAECYAVHEAFGINTDRLECVGRLDRVTSIYAIAN